MSSELCPENVPPKPSFSSSSSVYVVPIRSNHVANNSNVGVMRSPSVAEAAAANLLQGLLVAAPPPPPHDPLTEQQQQQKNVEKEEEGPVAERVRDQPDREAATTSNGVKFLILLLEF